MSQQRHEAQVSWHRDGAAFLDRRYSRAHEWAFDGGARIQASAAPCHVPVPYAVPEAVDPEEAFVASVSSCHMLWFLSIAAKRGFVIDRYVDEAHGVIEANQAGRRAFTRVTLAPKVEFGGGRSATPAELDAMHREAHNECFIANSLRCDVVIAAT